MEDLSHPLQTDSSPKRFEVVHFRLIQDHVSSKLPDTDPFKTMEDKVGHYRLT
jgi:hypothetical protein